MVETIRFRIIRHFSNYDRRYKKEHITNKNYLFILLLKNNFSYLCKVINEQTLD